MKKILLLFLLISSIAHAQGLSRLDSLSLNSGIGCHYRDSLSHGIIHFPRSPMKEPVVIYNNHSLLFIAYCEEADIAIFDSTGCEVFSTTKPMGIELITLPEWLSGEYELHIHRGNFCFWGTIEL